MITKEHDFKSAEMAVAVAEMRQEYEGLSQSPGPELKTLAGGLPLSSQGGDRLIPGALTGQLVAEMLSQRTQVCSA